MVAERESWLPRRVLLCGVALCHAISLASLHAQLPGLLGADGILPLREALRDHPSAPGLAAFAALCRLAGCEPELLAGALCLAGAAMAGALAAACALRPRPGGALAFAAFAALHVRQLAIASLGSTFLSFQWEVLLLEATVVAAACALLGGLNDVMAWAPRLLLFKLMLCSGQAKLTSGCPTWVDLSALRYHFATQPLPTPLAWFAAQQPPRLLRLGTAVALALEGPMAALLLAPLPRRDRAAGRPPAVHHPQGCCEAVPQPDREPEDSR